MRRFQDGQEARDVDELDQHGAEITMKFDSGIEGELQIELKE